MIKNTKKDEREQIHFWFWEQVVPLNNNLHSYTRRENYFLKETNWVKSKLKLDLNKKLIVLEKKTYIFKLYIQLFSLKFNLIFRLDEASDPDFAR